MEGSEVHLVEVRIEAAALHQGLMGALLDDLAVIEHDDLVGPANGRKPVGDDHGRAAAQQPLKPLLYQRLGVAVDIGRSLVKDEDAGICDDGPGEAQELALPTLRLTPRSWR